LNVFPVFNSSARDLPLSPKIPVLGDVSGLSESLLLDAVPVISSGEECRALPEAAVVTFVNVELAAE
jgi:hypothetical protein